MAPGGKPLQGMGRDLQSHNTGKHQRSHSKAHSTHAAGAQIGDDQERAEKDQRCAEIIHQRQETADYRRIADKENQIPLVHDPVHGGCPGKNEAHLRQFRRLNGHRANNQPVLCAIVFLAEYQSNYQKTDACNRGKIPEPLGPLQVAQRPADEQECNQAQANGDQLLDGFSRFYRKNRSHAHAAQEKRQGLHLKGTAVDSAIEEKQQPLAGHNAAKAQQDILSVFSPAGEQKAHGTEDLQHGQQQNVSKAVPERTGPGTQLGQSGLLSGRDRLQHHLYTANGNHIVGIHSADMHPSAVDIQAGFGFRVRNGPTSVIITGQYRMISGYRGEIHHNIAAFASTDNIFPMGNGQAVVLRKAQPSPNLRLTTECQQRFQTPQHQKKCQQRCNITQRTDIDIIHISLNLGEHLQKGFHTATSFHSSIHRQLLPVKLRIYELLPISRSILISTA